MRIPRKSDLFFRRLVRQLHLGEAVSLFSCSKRHYAVHFKIKDREYLGLLTVYCQQLFCNVKHSDIHEKTTTAEFDSDLCGRDAASLGFRFPNVSPSASGF